MERNRAPPRRTGSSRFLIPPLPPAAAAAIEVVGSKPEPQRKGRPPVDDAPTSSRALWPSTSKKSGTLADYLGNDRLNDLASSAHHNRRAGGSLARQRSCSEFARFDGDGDADATKVESESENSRRSKENRPLRYIGKLAFPRSSSKLGASSPSSSPNIAPARISIDDKALALRRSRSDITADFPSPESERSQPRSPAHRAPRAALYEPKIAGGEATIRRTNSYRSSTTQWALSPGRPTESPPTSSHGVGRRPSSNLRPSSPGRRVGNFISSLGFDNLFRRKPAAGVGGSPAMFASSPPRGGGGVSVVVGETAHQFRLLHNRLIQWRYLNARSDTVNHSKSLHAQNNLLSTWTYLSNLQASVIQKRMQIENEKLGFKINTILFSQVKDLEEWGHMERQHSTALSITKDCLQSAVSRVPLIERATADPQTLSIEIRKASNLVTTIKTIISIFTPMAQSIGPLLFGLAQVVTREKSLLEECFELLGLVATLQLQEQSLKCHLIQLNSIQQLHLSA